MFKSEFYHMDGGLCEDTLNTSNKVYDEGKDRKGKTFLRTEYLKECRAYLGSRNDQNDTQESINNRVELFLDCSRVENRKQKAIIEFYTYNLFTQTKDRISSHREATGRDTRMTYKRWIEEDLNDIGNEEDGQVLIIFDLGRG
jgi:hypothetical protein